MCKKSQFHWTSNNQNTVNLFQYVPVRMCITLYVCICSLQAFNIVHILLLKLLNKNNCPDAGEAKPKGLFTLTEIENENETYIWLF